MDATENRQRDNDVWKPKYYILTQTSDEDIDNYREDSAKRCFPLPESQDSHGRAKMMASYLDPKEVKYMYPELKYFVLPEDR